MNTPASGGLAGDDPLAFIPRSTRMLRMTMAEQQSALAPADFADLLGHVRRLFEKYLAALESAEPGQERARAFHRMMDAAVATAAHVAVSCRKGCCGCCHCEVEITRDEAVVLRDRIADGLAIDRERLAVQAARERLSPEWGRFWARDNRCIFLDEEGACRVYDDRPAVCRKLSVTTPAEACTTAGAPVAPVRMLLAEVLCSAAISLDAEGFASLSKVLSPLLPA